MHAQIAVNSGQKKRSERQRIGAGLADEGLEPTPGIEWLQTVVLTREGEVPEGDRAALAFVPPSAAILCSGMHAATRPFAANFVERIGQG